MHFAASATRSSKTIPTAQKAFFASGWVGGNEDMSGHYDRIKYDVAFHKDVANRCGVGFKVPVSLASIEPNEPKFEVAVEQEITVTV
jgi:hypothetical protein